VISLIGRLILIAAAVSSLAWASNGKLSNRIPAWAIHIAQVAPFMLLLLAFLRDWDTLDLVDRLGGSDLPILYRISAVWGGRAGPLLMWCFWMAAGSQIFAKFNQSDVISLRLIIGFTGILLTISAMLDPFAPSEGITDQLNPLLQTDLMVIHPPVIFAFYTLCIIPALISISSSLEDRDQVDVHDRIIPWARAAFVIGTAGIGLGGLWAYTVLDWGGYWAWDPVETASFLPWIGLVAVLHSRSQSTRSSRRVNPSIVIGVGALAMHATMVTRANGVWASVHAFAADGAGSESSDPYLRIISLANDGVAGVEVITYFVITCLFSLVILRNLIRFEANDLRKLGRESMRERKPLQSALLVIAVVLIGILSSSTLLLFTSLALMILIIEGDHEEPKTVWIFSGVALYLFASWSWMASLPQAVSGMAVFLVPWVVASPQEVEEVQLKRYINPRFQSRIAKSYPWFGAVGYLGLTWMLLTAEIDGTSLEAHEVFGAPFAAALAIALMVYSWGRRSNGNVGLLMIAGTLVISVAVGLNSHRILLPGDADRFLTDELTRGQVAGFLLSCTVLAMPPVLGEMFRSLRRSTRNSQTVVPTKWSSPNLRWVGSSIAHVGILMLLLGHILTTTMIDRTDPAHLVTLVRDQPVEHSGYTLTFTGLDVINSTDSDYEYSVADGMVEFNIEVADLDGNYIDTVSPGILRFDSPSGSVIPRSEVDRSSQLGGDLMFILDIQQANRVITNLMLGEIQDVDRVGVTVYDLKGSHLVWVGWILLLIGGSFAYLSKGNLLRSPTD